MEKELEELKSIVFATFGALGFFNPSKNEEILKDRDKVLNALERLESIDNANPSEALKWLEKYKPTILFNTTVVENALLKAQELEKVLEIIKELFDIQIIETDSKEMATITISRKGSNSALHFAQKLIKDKGKINLLKRWLENEKEKTI